MRTVRATALGLLTTLAFLGAGASARPARADARETSCVGCHQDVHPELVAAARKGVHFEVDLSCHDCHGGNADPALADDMSAAMDPDYPPNPYRGAPERTAIPEFCGRCHADIGFMKQYVADPRVDQLAEYRTSRHGEALAEGDTDVATCADCHRVHGIRRVDSPDAAVYPTNVAKTCAGCHADPQHMAGHTVDGAPIPTDQYADWQESVHAQALLAEGELSAPTCNDCHGDHGATPPGVESISRVCGHCHAREAELFRASPKEAAFETHRAFLESAGDAGCSGCHGAAKGEDVALRAAFTECETCHGNHAVLRPTVRMLGTLPETPCDFCHALPSKGDTGYLLQIRQHYARVREDLIARAPTQAEPALFDWLAEQARTLPAHTRPAAEASEDGEATPDGGTAAQGRVLRAEVQRLYEKLRIGPLTANRQGPHVQCTDCHAREPDMGESRGFDTARTYVDGMERLSRTTAQAQRVMLRARRGGVLVGDAQAELDQAVEEGIQLEVLVHTFASGPDSDFHQHLETGLGHARAALEAGTHALDELAWRRRGLFVFLGIVLVVLVAFILKIRQRAGPGGPPDREVAGE